MTDVDNNVPIPEEGKKTTPKRTPRARKPKAATIVPAKPADALIAALKFVGLAQKKSGDPQLTHCYAGGGWLAASNNAVTIGTRISENLNTCPNTFALLDALNKCGDDLAVTQLSFETLAVRSGEFYAQIPCVPFNEVVIGGPDEVCAVIDDRVRDALAAVMVAAVDNSPNPTFGAVLLQAQTAVATNGHMMLEAFHGIDLPPGMMLPKAAAVALSKSTKKLTGFGFSHSSATFHYEDGSFIKSQLYNEKYPNYAPLLNVDGLYYEPLDDLFFKAVKMVLPFASNGAVYFYQETVQTDGIYKTQEHRDGASYRIPGLPDNYAFDGKYLLTLQKAMSKVCFRGLEVQPKVYFLSENELVRGLLMGIGVMQTSQPSSLRHEAQYPTNYIEDDIPF